MDEEAYRFDFVVTGLTREQAECLMDVVLAAVELGGGQVGGGFSIPVRADVDQESEHDTPDTAGRTGTGQDQPGS